VGAEVSTGTGSGTTSSPVSEVTDMFNSVEAIFGLPAASENLLPAT
jgi:hypothetical protein